MSKRRTTPKPKSIKAGQSVYDDRERLKAIQQWNLDYDCRRCGEYSTTKFNCSNCENRG